MEAVLFKAAEFFGLPGNAGGVFLMLVVGWLILIPLIALFGVPAALCSRRDAT